MCLAEFEGFAPLCLSAVVPFQSVTLFFPRSRRRSRPRPFSVSAFQNCIAFWFVKSPVCRPTHWWDQISYHYPFQDLLLFAFHKGVILYFIEVQISLVILVLNKFPKL